VKRTLELDSSRKFTRALPSPYRCYQGARADDADSVFRREVEIWITLRHLNVLELYGASSATGDPPWSFVSPYSKNGSLAKYLKSLSSGGGGNKFNDGGKSS
jgi:hypothetical protein